MPRVVHFTNTARRNSINRVLTEQCRFRKTDRYQYLVAAVEAPDTPTDTDELQALGVPVVHGWAACQAAVQWADIINLHYDVWFPALHALVKASGKPYVITLHSNHKMSTVPTVTICVGKQLHLTQHDPDRCVYIPNGIDLTKFDRRSRRSTDRVVIVRICRPEKCALYYWPAIKQVLNKNPNAELWIVGNKAAGRSSNQIKFLGFRDDIPDILAQSDIFASTPYPTSYKTELSPGARDLALMEAMASGIPCVSSDVLYLRDQIRDGVTGFLTPFGDADAFADRLSQLIQDDQLRHTMGKASRQYAEDYFDGAKAAYLYEAVYEGVLEHVNGMMPMTAIDPDYARIKQETKYALTKIENDKQKARDHVAAIKQQMLNRDLYDVPTASSSSRTTSTSNRVQQLSMHLTGTNIIPNIMYERKRNIIEQLAQQTVV